MDKLGDMHRIACMLSLCVLFGCATPSKDQKATTAPTATIASSDHGRIHIATLEVLRELKFRIDHKDRQTGAVTTHPKIASSSLEPWRQDTTDAYLLQQSTLNFQRRLVRVQLDPVETGYRVRVEVDLQRRNHPPKPLTEASIELEGGVGVLRRDARTAQTERGTEQSFWHTIGRDHAYEHQLMELILRKAERRSAG